MSVWARAGLNRMLLGFVVEEANREGWGREGNNGEPRFQAPGLRPSVFF